MHELGRWINVQRQGKTKGTLSADRQARLDALGFDWNAIDSKWEAMFAELNRYKDRFGHCNVPDRWDENPQLGMWVVNQRMFKKREKLSPERMERLISLGFQWDVRAAKWEAMLADLKRYKDRFDDCNVPMGWAENPQLGRWVSKQRQRQRNITPARKARLDALGFEWSHKS